MVINPVKELLSLNIMIIPDWYLWKKIILRHLLSFPIVILKIPVLFLVQMTLQHLYGKMYHSERPDPVSARNSPFSGQRKAERGGRRIRGCCFFCYEFSSSATRNQIGGMSFQSVNIP